MNDRLEKISDSDYKGVLVNILKYFDNLCRNAGIKYSLIGGSLIGAIRHNGIIPWDDDVDVILMPEEYEKLIKALEKDNNKRYKALIPLKTKGYYMPYMKIIDTRTQLVEEGIIKKKENGVFIDVFKYGYIQKEKSRRFYNKTVFLRSLLAGTIETKRKNDCIKNIAKNIRRVTLGKVFKYEWIIKRYDKLFHNSPTGYLMSNWPCQGADKDTQRVEYLQSYVDHKFENMKAMIFRDYDVVLKTTFGDYMTPPPKEQRKPKHNMTAYWKR